MLRSIRWRIALIYTALILVTLLSLGVWLSNLSYDARVEKARISLTGQASLAANVVTQAIETNGQSTDFIALAAQLAEMTGSQATILDEEGRILGDTSPDVGFVEDQHVSPEVVQALASGFGYSLRTAPLQEQQTTYVAMPVPSDNQMTVVVRLAQPLSESPLDSGLRFALICTALLSSALAILLALTVIRPVTDSVRGLTKMAYALGRGNFESKVTVSSGDELGELETAFNLMTTQLRDSLRSLSQQKTRLETILANMADGVMIVDQKGQVLLSNRASSEILHWPQAMVLGRTFVQVARDHELAEALAECLKTGTVQRRVVETGPQRQVVRALFSLMTSDAGKSVLVLLQDLTEMRRAEATRRDFVANVSHDLRTPLASIKALVETLQAGALDDREAAEHFLDRMNVEVDNLTQLVRELLELSRIESGKADIKPQEEDIEKLLLGVVARMQAQADRAGLVVNVEAAPGLPHVLVDADRIQQVVSNLLHNAIKFTPHGGAITVTARPGENAHVGRIVVEVRDSGVGIASEDVPRIFERFYKADKARTGGGSGLGLAIAKHVVQAHGGVIWAESVLGQGAVFAFTVPISDEK